MSYHADMVINKIATAPAVPGSLLKDHIMSLCIDRFNQVIINTNGKAHLTGWVIAPVVRDLPDGRTETIGRALAQGVGTYVNGTFVTKSWGPFHRYEGALTVNKFVGLTGWSAE